MSAKLEQFVVVNRRQNHTNTRRATPRQERPVSPRRRVPALKLADVGNNEHIARAHVDPRELKTVKRGVADENLNTAEALLPARALLRCHILGAESVRWFRKGQRARRAFTLGYMARRRKLDRNWPRRRLEKCNGSFVRIISDTVAADSNDCVTLLWHTRFGNLR